jgi:hypothetical protein
MPMTITEYLKLRSTMMEMDRFSRPPATKAFLHGAHAMNGEAERDRAAAKADVLALLTILEDTTQSRSVAERCAKAKAVLG